MLRQSKIVITMALPCMATTHTYIIISIAKEQIILTLHIVFSLFFLPIFNCSMSSSVTYLLSYCYYIYQYYQFLFYFTELLI